MDKFVIKRSRSPSLAHAPTLIPTANVNCSVSGCGPRPETSVAKKAAIEFNLGDIISDSGHQISIDNYDANIRDQVCRAYLVNGPYQPSNHIFPKKQNDRSFHKNWFTQNDWLEYSVSKNELIDEYQKNFGESWRTVQADSTQPWPYLNEALTKFQESGPCRGRQAAENSERIGRNQNYTYVLPAESVLHNIVGSFLAPTVGILQTVVWVG